MKIKNRLLVIVTAIILSAVALQMTACKEKQSAAIKTKGTTLQMDFVVAKEKVDSFENMYTSIYIPAMKVQQGYWGSKLIRIYSDDMAKSIEAEPTIYNYQLQIYFDSEDNRKRWVSSDQHKIAWPAATALAPQVKWRGYDVIGDDDQR